MGGELAVYVSNVVIPPNGYIQLVAWLVSMTQLYKQFTMGKNVNDSAKNNVCMYNLEHDNFIC